MLCSCLVVCFFSSCVVVLCSWMLAGFSLGVVCGSVGLVVLCSCKVAFSFCLVAAL